MLHLLLHHTMHQLYPPLSCFTHCCLRPPLLDHASLTVCTNYTFLWHALLTVASVSPQTMHQIHPPLACFTDCCLRQCTNNTMLIEHADQCCIRPCTNYTLLYHALLIVASVFPQTMHQLYPPLACFTDCCLRQCTNNTHFRPC